MSKLTASVDFDRVKAEEMPRFINLFAEQVESLINNGLTFSDNFDAKIVSVSITTADTDFAVAHGLGREPLGYFVIGQTANMGVYNGSRANSASVLYLRASAVGTASVLVF
jgi:hypothetical protein